MDSYKAIEKINPDFEALCNAIDKAETEVFDNWLHNEDVKEAIKNFKSRSHNAEEGIRELWYWSPLWLVPIVKILKGDL